MPTYEFRCPKGHEFEKFYRSIGVAPREVACPSCGKIAERQMSAGGGLVFKGSGFYITDYGKDGKKPQTAPAATGDSVPGSGTPETAATKGESNAKGDAKPSADAKASEPAKPTPAAKVPDKTSSSGKPKRSE
jgi:putative FmdB family regulatory protein